MEVKITTPKNKEEQNVKGPNPKKQIKKTKYQKRQGSGAHHAHNRQDKT